MRFTDPSTLCFFLLATIVVVLMFRTRVRLATQGQHTKENRAPDAHSGHKREMPPLDRETTTAEHDLARWEVQMHETARELSAQLDAKLSLLQSLTAEADRAAERLEEALARSHPAIPPGSQAESLRPISADELGADSTRELPAGTDRSRSREEIYHLADYGFAPAEIARRVGSPVGEVELILSLRQN